MNSFTRMKNALPATLAIGSLSVLASLFCMLILYADWVGQPQYLAPVPSPNYEKFIISSQDFDALKHNCLQATSALNNTLQLAQIKSSILERIERGFVLFVLVWGLVSGTVLLYVHFLLRRAVKNEVL